MDKPAAEIHVPIVLEIQSPRIALAGQPSICVIAHCSIGARTFKTPPCKSPEAAAQKLSEMIQMAFAAEGIQSFSTGTLTLSGEKA